MKDVTQYPWLHKRSSTYYLRAPVPVDIRQAFGRKEVWRSLKTSDKKIAVQRLRELTPKVLEEFKRCKAVADTAVSEVIHELTAEQLNHIEACYYQYILDEDDEMRLIGFGDEKYDEWAETQDLLDDHNRHEFARGKVSSFYEGEARDVLTWTNVQINLAPDSSDWRKVARALYSATIRAFEIKRQRNNGDVIPTPEMPNAAASMKRGPSLENAKQFYLQEKVSGDEHARKKIEARLDRMMLTIKEALGSVPLLADWVVDDAYKVRDYLLAKGTLKPSSVARELNTIRGVFSFYIQRKDRKLFNPFQGLQLPASVGVDKDRRLPLPQDVIVSVRKVLSERSKKDLYHIWEILSGTGCRLAEVVGLRMQDIVLDDRVPFIRIVDHEKRRLKTLSSNRDIPLIGEALEAVKEAIAVAEDSDYLFSTYARPGGPDAASAALMKVVRKITKNPLHTVHSLRHSFADRCDLAGVSPTDKSAILGHHNDSTSERHYGSRSAKLVVLSKAMSLAFPLVDAEQ